MKVRWTAPETRDLAAIFRYIRKDKPDTARNVKASISKQVSTLVSMPLRGRGGSVEGTREMIFHPWPYIAVYRVVADEVQIIRIRHAVQEWP